MIREWEEAKKYKSAKAAARESRKRIKWLAESGSKENVIYFYDFVTEPICEHFVDCDFCYLNNEDEEKGCILSELDGEIEAYLYSEEEITINDVKEKAKKTIEQINKRFNLYRWIKMK